MKELKDYRKYVILAVPLILIVFAAAAYVTSQSHNSDLKRFSSMGEIESYLKGASGTGSIFYYGTDMPRLKVNTAEVGANDYLTTNIQVAGVDEADIVKSDGNYIYIASGDTVYIMRTYPPEEAEIVSKITINNSYSVALYINGDRLVVIGNGYSVAGLLKRYPISIANSFVKVYDITDRSSPELVRELVTNGTVSGSRMIGDYVYIVSQKHPYVYDYEGEDYKIELPSYEYGNITKEIAPHEVYYIESEETYYYFITVISLNIADESTPPSDETFLAGASSTMYVSTENMYLVAHRSYPVRIMIFPPSTSADDWREETTVYRLGLDDGKIALEANGKVPGQILNQYSMDEYNGYFRVATTEWTSNGSENAVYVLNMEMEIVGSLEDVAPGERIYSARFMGDRCYLVTFRQVDPFFVIDLSDPTRPSVLGYLKIPGYSSYLHPIDKDHMIGLGKEENNLKLSLFNVEDVGAPKEVAKFWLEYAYSDSEALYDPKAFLFDAGRQILAIPVGWTEQGGAWNQGAFVFNVSTNEGVVLRGTIVHQSGIEGWNLTIRRILYIEDTIYTVSNDQVWISDFGTLDLIKTIVLI